ncbi:MAG: hypothetical protein ACOX68_00540 [Candidatus Limivicinus sp.]|jgi:hypothetical protein
MSEAVNGDGVKNEKVPEEKDRRCGARDGLKFADLAGKLAELLNEAIKSADPADLRDIKQLTGALKDLKELMQDDEGKPENEDIVIRIEGDPTLQ